MQPIESRRRVSFLQDTQPPENEPRTESGAKPVLQALEEHLNNVSKCYFFDKYEDRQEYVFKPLELALDNLPHLAGEELLFAMTSFHLLSQLHQATNSSDNLIYGLCELATHFFKEQVSPCYESIYGSVVWCEFISKRLYDMEPLQGLFSYCSGLAARIWNKNSTGEFTQCQPPIMQTPSGHPYQLIGRPRTRLHDWYAFSYCLRPTIAASEKSTLISGLVEWQYQTKTTGLALAWAIVALSITYGQVSPFSIPAWVVTRQTDFTMQKWSETLLFKIFTRSFLGACRDKDQLCTVTEALALLQLDMLPIAHLFYEQLFKPLCDRIKSLPCPSNGFFVFEGHTQLARVESIPDAIHSVAACQRLQSLTSAIEELAVRLAERSCTYDSVYMALYELSKSLPSAVQCLLKKITTVKEHDVAQMCMERLSISFFADILFPSEFSLRVYTSPRVLSGFAIQDYIQEATILIKELDCGGLVNRSRSEVVDLYCITLFVREIKELARQARILRLLDIQCSDRLKSKNALLHLLFVYYGRLTDPFLKERAYNVILELPMERAECRITCCREEMEAVERHRSICFQTVGGGGQLILKAP